MDYKILEESDKKAYNSLVSHVIQSWEWGEFRKKTGVDIVRVGIFKNSKMISAFQVTFHKIPYLNKTIGYFPKGPMPSKLIVDGLSFIAKEKKAAYIKLEPNVEIRQQADKVENLENLGLVKSKKSLFTKYNFIVDLTKSEEELLNSFHPKTRYNIRLAQRKGVEVYESTKDEDFEDYLKLYFETTKRQKYFGHTPHYHKLVWETLKNAGMARVLVGKFKGKVLTTWMLFCFGDTLYYPYGGSSLLYKEVMASNLVAWEAIKLGKKMGFKKLDLWGALGTDADPSDPWYGFHKFKLGYSPRHVEYIGTYDLVFNKTLYKILNFADKARWILLRLFKG